MVSRFIHKGGLAACLLFILCSAILLVPLQTTVFAQGQTQHVVRTGDTLYSLANRYDTTVSAIRALNNLSVNDYIYVGQVLQIPGSQTVTTTPQSTSTGCSAQHTVSSGDTLLAIAAWYDVSAAEIATANNLANANFIYIGQVLCIPGAGTVVSPPPSTTPSPLVTTSPSTGDGTYEVKGGDNLFRIALDHGISLDALLSANGLTENSYIWPGQILIIPGGGTQPRAPQPTPVPPQPTPVPPQPTPVPPQPTPVTPQPGSTTPSGVPDISANAYTAKYFNNTSLSGTPVLTVVEAAPLEKKWGLSSPGTGVNADQFSASFDGNFNFEAATYRFITVVDDGMKLFIDGHSVKEVWKDQPASSYIVDLVMTAGTHHIRLEYYDGQESASVTLRWLKLLSPGTALESTPSTETAPAPAPAPVTGPVTSGSLNFAYGIQAHALGRRNATSALNHVNDLGFTWIKQQVRWEDMEPSRGNRRWGELDELLAEAQSRNVHVLFSVVAAPAWARESGADLKVAGPPANNADFANYLGALAGRYCGGSLRAIEVWNEQNLHYEWGNLSINAGAYVSMLQAASSAIRTNCSSMFIISGALTPAGDNGTIAVDDFTYMRQMLQAGMANYVDGIGAHPSGFNVPPNVTWLQACDAIKQYGNSFNGACDTPHHSWSFRSTMEGYHELAVNNGAASKPIVATEFGWAAGGKYHPSYGYADDNSFQEQANWTVEAYSMMRNWGWAGPAFLWNLNFRVVANGTERAQWGIVNSDWSPLPAYTALKQVAK